MDLSAARTFAGGSKLKFSTFSVKGVTFLSPAELGIHFSKEAEVDARLKHPPL